MSKNIKFVKRAGLWCVSEGIKNPKDNKQKMHIEFFSLKEDAEKAFNVV